MLDVRHGESMTRAIDLKIEGLEKVNQKFSSFRELPHYLKGAGIEASNKILNTRGLRRYPPATEANMPPAPYYKRGVGMQLHGVRHDGRRFISGNLKNSQQLGKRWQVVPYGRNSTKISNPVTYAPYVHGGQPSYKPARHMEKIGWKSLFLTAIEKTEEITKIYQNWVNQLLRKHGLL
jgi:predicted DNA-binding protein (MmcQ/YjbR family)